MRLKDPKLWAAAVVAIGAAIAIALVLSGGGDDGGTSTTVETRPVPNPDSGSAIELTYVADSPYGKPVTQHQLNQAVETLRRRARLLGLGGTKIRVNRSGQPVITYPAKDFARAASSQLPVQGRMYFYDFDADVIGSANEPVPEIFDAVQTASKRRAVESPDNTTGRQYYLFGGLQNYRGGPTGTRADLLAKYSGRVPAESQVDVVQPGTIVVLAAPLSNSLDPSQFKGAFVMRDRPGLGNADTTNPRYAEQDGNPVVLFGFTSAGRRKLQAMTRRMAERAADGEKPELAVVLDNQILSRAPVDPDQNPDGLDGRNGVSVGGDVTKEQAENLAAVLQSGPLPFRMIPVLQEQLSRDRVQGR